MHGLHSTELFVKTQGQAMVCSNGLLVLTRRVDVAMAADLFAPGAVGEVDNEEKVTIITLCTAMS